MVKHVLVLSFLVISLGISAQNKESDASHSTGESIDDEEPVKRKFPVAKDRGKILTEGDKKLLWGGEDPKTHFDITECELKDEQFHFGIGREKFPALVKPEFTTVEEAKSTFQDEDRFLLLKAEGETKAYSVKDLTRHEVVNDRIGDKPIMAAYCILANLGAIYDRTYDNKEYTFALSGYTYFDPEVWDGMDGFVMWDRETESLWWPLIGTAVSGKMKGSKMKVLDQSLWSQTTWKEIVAHHPKAQVLKSGQDFERPENWIKYEKVKPSDESKDSVAPRWGENAKVK